MYTFYYVHYENLYNHYFHHLDELHKAEFKLQMQRNSY